MATKWHLMGGHMATGVTRPLIVIVLRFKPLEFVISIVVSDFKNAITKRYKRTSEEQIDFVVARSQTLNSLDDIVVVGEEVSSARDLHLSA